MPNSYSLSENIPIVYIGLEYKVRGPFVDFICKHNDKIFILTNAAQDISPSACVTIVDIKPFEPAASSEMPWWPTFPGGQRVFFRRWYVLRDWMRRSGIKHVFTADADALIYGNITNIVHSNLHHFQEKEYW